MTENKELEFKEAERDLAIYIEEGVSGLMNGVSNYIMNGKKELLEIPGEEVSRMIGHTIAVYFLIKLNHLNEDTRINILKDFLIGSLSTAYGAGMQLDEFFKDIMKLLEERRSIIITTFRTMKEEFDKAVGPHKSK